MKILITGVGGPTPRSFALALKRYSKYADWEFVATDINPLAIGLYQKELFKESFIVPAAGSEGYWEAIERIVAETGVEYAVILPEKEVMHWSRREQEGKLPCKAFLPHPAIAEVLVDKGLMTKILDELGDVPKSMEFGHDLEHLSAPFDLLGKHFWVRSSQGTSGLGSLLIESPEALKNWMQINPGVTTFLASTYLSGRNLACKLLYYRGQLIRAACAERVNYIMSKVAPSGITGNTSFGRLLNEPNLVSLAEKNMQHLFVHLGIEPHGFFTMDFKEDSTGKPFITEVNVRHVAFTQCFAAGGANFAEDTIRLLDNPDSMDMNFKIYEFEPDTIFLRDVDAVPVLMKESALLKR